MADERKGKDWEWVLVPKRGYPRPCDGCGRVDLCGFWAVSQHSMLRCWPCAFGKAADEAARKRAAVVSRLWVPSGQTGGTRTSGTSTESKTQPAASAPKGQTL